MTPRGALALLLAACAPTSSVDAGVVVDAGPLAASNYCETIEPFYCPYYLRCGRIDADTPAECTAKFLETCNARYEPSYVDLETAGLLTLSRAGVEACRAHLADVRCEEQPLDLDGPCASMWQGRQPAGGDCGLDLESFVCAPGTTCVLGLDFCGTCTPIAGVDEPCGSDAGTACAREAQCIDGRCVRRGLDGDPCGDGAPCALGVRCDVDVCRAPELVDVDDACDQTHRCPFASRCVDGFCRASAALDETCDAAAGGCASGYCDGTCVELLAPAALCDQSAQCRTGICADGACAAVPGVCFDG